MIYFGENANTGAATDRDGDGKAIRLGYAKGPINVAGTLSRTKYATGQVRQDNIGGSYDFGVVRLMAMAAWDRNGSTKARGSLLGAVIPAGAGDIRASYSQYVIDKAGPGPEPKVAKLALSYVYYLLSWSA